MGLEIWFMEDIRNALLAAAEGRNPSLEKVRAILSHIIERGYQVGAVSAVIEAAYKAGYMAALKTVALAFGLSPAIIGNAPPVLEAQLTIPQTIQRMPE